MSIRLMTFAWELDLPIGEKMLLLKLADRANDDGECWPGQADLAQQCSMSVRALRDNMKRLVEKGLVEVEYRNHGMRRGSNVYHLIINNIAQEMSKSRPAESAARTDSRPADCDKPTGNHCRSYIQESSLKAIIMAEEAESPPLPADSTYQEDTPYQVDEGIQFDAISGMFCNIPDAQWTRWEKAYPKIDVDAEILKAEAWYLSNPKRRKKDHGRFLTNWLSRANGVALNPTMRRAA